MTQTTIDNLIPAMDYALRGWSVFPVYTVINGVCSCGCRDNACNKRGKHPLNTNGVDGATTDLTIINQWWGKYPFANIGINTGKSGLFAVDCDIKNGIDGVANWQALSGDVDTLTAITGSGGRHFVFQDPGNWQADVKPKPDAIAKNIDIRCNNSYIIVAPSFHKSGKQYAWVDPNKAPAPMPDHVRRIIEDAYTPKDSWGEPFTLADCLLPRPPKQYILDKIFCAPSVNMLFGDGGSLKSFVLADLAICVATGAKFLDAIDGSKGIATMRAPAVWLDFDQGADRVKDRFAALARARHITNAPIYTWSMPTPWLDAGDPGAISDLTRRIITLGARLVIVDALVSVSGDADENSKDMARVMQGFRMLAENTGAAVVIVHHQNKPNGTTRKIGDTIRGHSSIKSNLDTALLVERKDQETKIAIRCAKGRDGTIQDFGAEFTYTHDENGELDEARFIPADVESKIKNSQAQIENDLIAVLRDEGEMNKRNLFPHVKGTWDEKAKALANLLILGLIVSDGKPRGAIYSLPTDK